MRDIHEEARGRWRGILSHYGMSQKELSGKHGPCPMCGGMDRFRFDNKGGAGTWICNNCGAGNGVDLVMGLKGWDFGKAVQEIRPLVGMSPLQDAPKPQDEGKRREARKALWNSSVPLSPGCPADSYFKGRGVDRPNYSPALRYCPSARYDESKSFPAIVAAVQEPGGKAVSLHRTFIADGEKAPVDAPKKLMPGTIDDGSAIRLSQVTSTMGIAEGIETALAAWEIFGVPTWAAISSTIMAKWVPPKGVSEVFIFGDNDPGFAGQVAAYGLAKSLHRQGIKVRVVIPNEAGTDWADHLGKDGREIFSRLGYLEESQ